MYANILQLFPLALGQNNLCCTKAVLWVMLVFESRHLLVAFQSNGYSLA